MKNVAKRGDEKVVSNTKTTWNRLQNWAACHKKYLTMILLLYVKAKLNFLVAATGLEPTTI